MSPTKPTQRRAAPVTADNLPIGQSEMITLPDGKQIPIRVPPGLPPQIAAMVVQQLRSDPAAAQAAFEQAQRVLATPGLAQAYLRMGAAAAGGGAEGGGAVGLGASAEDGGAAAAGAPGLPPGLAPERALEALSADPELASVVEELKAGGPAALEKYWDDAEVMSKISARLRAASLADKKAAAAGGADGGGDGADAAASYDADGLPLAKKPAPASPSPSPQQQQPGGGAPPTPPAAAAGASPAAAAVHAAARKGDAAAVKALLAAAGDSLPQLIDAPGGRSGASPLGVAVGLGRLEAARALLDAGADVNKGDSAGGSTPAHYAAGYGRRECLELLLERGADPSLANASGQTAADVAQRNGESAIMALLAAREKKARKKKAAAGAGGGGAGPSLPTKKASAAAASKKA